MFDSLEAAYVASLSHDRAPLSPVELAELGRALAEAEQRAREAWPGVNVPGDVFARYVAERAPDDGPPAAAISGLRLEDLYLACACVQGVKGAPEAFERAIMSQVPKAVARVDSAAYFVDEVTALVRVKLLVGDDGPGRVASYLGRGPLSAFAQVVALRIAQSDKRRGSSARVDPADMLDVEFEGADPELARLRTQVREPFGRAFRASLADLSPRQRTVLRLYLVEDVSSESIATMYRVHRATIARWVSDARTAVLSGTRRRLMQELGLGARSFDSLMGQVVSQLDVSLATFLRDEPSG